MCCTYARAAGNGYSDDVAMSWKHRNRKRLASYFLLGSVLIQLVSCASEARELMIGGLFGSDEDENIVNAFRYAVYYVNHRRDLLQNIKLHSDVQHLHNDNRFEASRRNIKLHSDVQHLHNDNRFEASRRICEQLSRRTFAIFGPLNQDMAAFTGSACSSLNVPHLETRVDASTVPLSPYSINLHPDSDFLAKATLDVIKHFGWTEMLIIYGDQIGLLKIQTLIRASNQTADMSVIVRQTDLRNMRAVLKEAKKKQWRHIVAELNITETQQLLKMALQEGMIDSYHHFIINNMDIDLLDLEDYRHNFVNLTGYRLVHMESQFSRNIFSDMNSFSENTQLPILKGSHLPYQAALIFDTVYLFANALKRFDRYVAFRSPNSSCDEIDPWTSGKTLYDYINTEKVDGITGRIDLSHGRRLDFQLAIMELGEEGLQRTGTWSVGGGVNITVNRFIAQGVFGNKTLIVSTVLPPYAMKRKVGHKAVPLKGNQRYEGFCIDLLNEIARIVGLEFIIQPAPDQRSDQRCVDVLSDLLKLVSLIATKHLRVLEPPYAMKRKDGHKAVPLKGNQRYEGFCIDLLNEIARIVGFEFTIQPAPDQRYGVFNKDTKEWDGIVRQLNDREADLAVAALTISYEREQFIDFTKPFLNLGISILFTKPRREAPGLFSFMNPLAIEIWVYVVAAYFVVSLTIFILARFSPYEWYNPHPCNPETDTVANTFTLSNSFWFCVGTLMQQGSDVNPRAVSTRIVGSTWWLFTLIIISSYTANLAAFLTVERMVSPIEGAEDLAKQLDISYGTLEGGSTMQFFRDSHLETYQRMWNYMESTEPSVFTKTVPEGVNRVETNAGRYAYLMESTSIEYIVQRNCKLMQIGGLLDSKGYGIATPMESPLKDKLSMAILNLQEDGKIQMLYNKWWKSSGQCAKDEKTESKANALGVENVGGIFVVLIGGLTCAVIVAFLEFVWNSKKNATEDKQSLCSEMTEELCFAVRCHGSSHRPKFKKRMCLKCKSLLQSHSPECPLNVTRAESANGSVPMRDRAPGKNSCSLGRDYEMEYLHEKCVEFGAGGYLHVDYSDTDT